MGGEVFLDNNLGENPVDGSRMKDKGKTTKRSHHYENSNHTCIRYVI